jgi:hypothetical protein
VVSDRDRELRELARRAASSWHRRHPRTALLATGWAERDSRASSQTTGSGQPASDAVVPPVSRGPIDIVPPRRVARARYILDASATRIDLEADGAIVIDDDRQTSPRSP